MNKTLLLILCDFLLLNLLYAHSLKKGYIDGEEAPPAEEYAANLTTGQETNLLEVMKLALEEEAAARQALSNELASIETNLEKKEENLSSVESERSSIQKELFEAQQAKMQADMERAEAAQSAAELSRQKEELAKQRAELEKSLRAEKSAAEQRELELQIQRDAEAKRHRAEVAARETALREKEAELARRQADLAELQTQNLSKQKELQKLQVKVEVAEVKQDMLRESLEARVQRELELKEEEAKKKQEALAKLEAQKAAAEKLARDLELAVAKAEVEKKLLRDNLTEKLEQQTEEQKRKLRERETEIAELAKQKLAAQDLVNSLNTAVQTASVENRNLRDNVNTMKEEIAIVRQEKAQLAQTTAKLTQGVAQLAQKSESVAQGVTQISGRTEAIAQDVGRLNATTAQVQKNMSKVAQQSAAVKQEVTQLAVKSDTIAQNVTNLAFKSERISTDVGKLQQKSAEITQGVVQLAKKSDNLAQEMRENRPINLNMLFTDFRSNRIDTAVTGIYKGLFGRPVDQSSSVSSVLIEAGRKVYSIVHIKNTPFNLSERGTDWQKITGIMSRPGGTVRFNSIEFLSTDPRVLLIPMEPEQVKRLGSRPYPTTNNPFKFTEAVLISKDGEYYGETPFRVDPKAPQYVKMKSSLIRRVFGGDFSPSTGDLVFSKTGELLGVMVNRQYCVVLNNFTTARAIDFRDNLSNVKTGSKFEEMHWKYSRLPAEVR